MNPAYVAVALDMENLDCYLAENVDPDPMAYRMDSYAVVHRCDSHLCHRCHADKMVDYRTRTMMMVAIVGRVDVVTIYCCWAENFHRHLIHLNLEI